MNLSNFVDSPATNWIEMRLSIPSKEDSYIMPNPDVHS
ncbi:hypothetical protein SynPROSU1_01902 [Synechococcus sp. PROS-U-1]|nr:hypothetical protein SynPROSU1_01902 [Synechococcus sp. PROS-U-1]